MNQQNLESITFEEAIQMTQSLIDQIQSQEISQAEIESKISALVKTENGARGFFVTYLTDDQSLADTPTPEVINALKTSPEIVSELLVKNVAMSTATALAHRRNDNEEMAKSSERVQQRSINLIKQLQLDILANKLNHLRLSLETNGGNYQEFLNRWHYDTEQRQQIHQVVFALCEDKA